MGITLKSNVVGSLGTSPTKKKKSGELDISGKNRDHLNYNNVEISKNRNVLLI